MTIFSTMDICCQNLVIRGAWVFDKQISDGAIMSSFIQLQKEYPFLSGRMSADGKSLRHQDILESMIFTVDKSLTIKDLAKSEKFLTGQLYDKIAPKFSLSDFKKGKCAPIIAELMQIADGSVLMVQCAHICFDGSSFQKMISRWGEICSLLQGEKPHEPICTEGATLDQSLAPRGTSRTKEETIALAQTKGWVKLTTKKLLLMALELASGISKKNVKRLHLSLEEVEKLKKECGEIIGANAALSAFVVKKIMEANGKSAGTEYELVTVTDLRGKWNNLPEGFVGNAVANVVTRGLSSKDSLPELAGKIQSNLSSTLSDSSRLNEIAELSIDSFTHKIPYVAFDVAAMGSRRPTTIYINNMLKFRPFDINYGTGRPVLVTPNDLPDMVKITASADGGVEIILRGYPAIMCQDL